MGVLDAIAYGIPVVTTPVGGIMDVMHNGVDGLIFETYNIESLSGCLVRLMESEDLRKQLVVHADALMKNEFDINRICEQIGNIYAELSK